MHANDSQLILRRVALQVEADVVAGGNAQVTNRPKVFVVVSSVEVGMEFKAHYINNYGGNYARWYSTDAHAQELYRQTLQTITPRIVNSFH
jgi:hypothetical protein